MTSTYFSSRSRVPSDPSFDAAIPGSGILAPFDLACTDTTGWPGSEELERSVLRMLDHPDAIRYIPDSAGSLQARRALAESQEPSDPSRWILTASSSEAYSLLFQLLCDAGARVAVPRPGYPLVEELGRFQLVSVAPIPLRRQGSTWCLDLGWTEKRLREGVRALVLIQPANPTGWILSSAERRAVLDLCRRYQVPLISDEVFEAWADSSFESLATQNEVLCFTLGGLSKLLGFPHLKLGWIRITGPLEQVQEARKRLEVLNDALLSASTPVQCALPGLLRNSLLYQERIHRRLELNRTAWRAFQTRIPEGFEALDAQNGWFCTLQWKHPLSEEVLVRSAVDHGVRILSGYLFDLPDPGVVVSLVSEPSAFIHGLSVLSDLLYMS